MTSTPEVNEPVERKVAVGTVVSLLVAGVIAVLNAVVADNTLLGVLPPVVQWLVLTGVPPALVFLGAYRTKHTYRT